MSVLETNVREGRSPEEALASVQEVLAAANAKEAKLIPDHPWTADILTPGRFWDLQETAVLLYCSCDWAPVARAALELAGALGAEQHREEAQRLGYEVYEAHDMRERVAAWQRLQAWFEAELWPIFFED